jgi:hypothetical protein
MQDVLGRLRRNPQINVSDLARDCIFRFGTVQECRNAAKIFKGWVDGLGGTMKVGMVTTDKGERQSETLHIRFPSVKKRLRFETILQRAAGYLKDYRPKILPRRELVA